MNRLESAVRSVMHSLGMKQLSDAAVKTGIPKSALYKITVGEIGLSPTNLRKLVTGLSSDPAHQFLILSAHLYDEAERGSKELASAIRIELDVLPPGGAGFSDLPEKLRNELRVIGDRVKDGDEDLGGFVSWVASAITPVASFTELAAEDAAPSGLSAAERVIVAEQDKRRKERQRAKKPAPYPKPGKH